MTRYKVEDEVDAVRALNDGFRPRRKRPKGWLAKAIKDGSVRDPDLGPNPSERHSPDAVRVESPVMTADQEDPDGGHK